MIKIRPIREDEIPAAKRVILTVACSIFGWENNLEDSIRHFEASGEYDDMDDLQSHYFENGGLFLAALDDDKLIGTGAIRKLNDCTAELKRVWLLEAYQGRGIGFQLVKQLLDFASVQSYQRVRLQTSYQQKRALALYKRVGFAEIPCYNDAPEEVSMEILLDGTKRAGSSS